MNILKLIYNSFINFIAPSHCEVCGIYTGDSDSQYYFICDDCLAKLPSMPDSQELILKLSKNFQDKIFCIRKAYAFFSLDSNSNYMNLIYSLKYKGQKKIGINLGQEFGKILKRIINTKYDLIIPVPIHRARMRERGYNQSEMIALGISPELGIEVDTKIIKRTKYTQTQTQLSFEERKKNVENVFAPYRNNINLEGKKILLIDDVLTTGSTLNSCSMCLLNLGAKSVDIATLVYPILN